MRLGSSGWWRVRERRMKELLFGRRYRVTEKIGSGGMADIYRAVDETLGRTVAVKVMHARFASESNFAARFRQEAQAAANLVSPHIVNMYDWGQDGDSYYIVMEYVQGSDLKQIEQGSAMPSAQVAEIGAQVCSALSVAHGYDVIHRDIKPHNIMVQPDRSVKVMDFGIARAGDSALTQTGSVMGTAHYLSPEQAQGKPLSPASDLYSLGVTLYEAATGRLPFDADNPVTVALMHVSEAAALPSTVNPVIDPALESVIVKAMQKNPADRYSSADEMRRELNAIVTSAASAETTVMSRVDKTAVMPLVGAGAVAGAGLGAGVGTDAGAAVGGDAAADTDAQDGGRRHTWAWALLAVLLIAAGIGIASRLGSSGDSAGDPPRSTTSSPGGRATDSPAATPPTETAPAVVTQPELATVPGVVGMNADEAFAALEDAGFTPQALPAEYNADVAENEVYEQSPVADAEAEMSSVVSYAVSRGPDPNAGSRKDGRQKPGKSKGND